MYTFLRYFFEAQICDMAPEKNKLKNQLAYLIVT